MRSKAALALAEERGGDNGLIMHKDFLMHSVMKVFIKDEGVQLQQGLHAHAPGLPVGYYIKRFNPAIEPFIPEGGYKTKD